MADQREVPWAPFQVWAWRGRRQRQRQLHGEGEERHWVRKCKNLKGEVNYQTGTSEHNLHVSQSEKIDLPLDGQLRDNPLVFRSHFGFSHGRLLLSEREKNI